MRHGERSQPNPGSAVMPNTVRHRVVVWKNSPSPLSKGGWGLRGPTAPWQAVNESPNHVRLGDWLPTAPGAVNSAYLAAAGRLNTFILGASKGYWATWPVGVILTTTTLTTLVVSAIPNCQMHTTYQCLWNSRKKIIQDRKWVSYPW